MQITNHLQPLIWSVCITYYLLICRACFVCFMESLVNQANKRLITTTLILLHKCVIKCLLMYKTDQRSGKNHGLWVHRNHQNLVVTTEFSKATVTLNKASFNEITRLWQFDELSKSLVWNMICKRFIKKVFFKAVQVNGVVVLKAWRVSNVVSFVSGFLCFLDGYVEGNVVWLCATLISVAALMIPTVKRNIDKNTLKHI